MTPTIEYDPDGDQIEAHLSRESYYGERINDDLTLYRSQATKEIVGFCVSGVRRLVDPS